MCVISPAARFEQCLRIAYGLATDGQCLSNGTPRNFWHMALLMEMGETYLPGLPLGLQQGIFRLLSGLAHRLGKHKEVEKYYRARELSGKDEPLTSVAGPKQQSPPFIQRVG